MRISDWSSDGALPIFRSDRIGIEGAKALEYTVGSDLQAAFTFGMTVGTVIDDPRTGRMLVAYEPLEIVGNPYFVVEAQPASKALAAVDEMRNAMILLAAAVVGVPGGDRKSKRQKSSH